jgi:hypothetical protein
MLHLVLKHSFYSSIFTSLLPAAVEIVKKPKNITGMQAVYCSFNYYFFLYVTSRLLLLSVCGSSSAPHPIWPSSAGHYVVPCWCVHSTTLAPFVLSFGCHPSQVLSQSLCYIASCPFLWSQNLAILLGLGDKQVLWRAEHLWCLHWRYFHFQEEHWRR